MLLAIVDGWEIGIPLLRVRHLRPPSDIGNSYNEANSRSSSLLAIEGIFDVLCKAVILLLVVEDDLALRSVRNSYVNCGSLVVSLNKEKSFSGCCAFMLLRSVDFVRYYAVHD